LGTLVSIAGTFAVLRPNRLLRGEDVTLQQSSPQGFWLLMVAWVVILVASLPRTGRIGAVLRGLGADAIILASTLVSANVAADFMARQGALARVSLGVGYWLTLLACYVVIFSALQRLKTIGLRSLVALPGPLGVVVLLVTGHLDSLAIMQEYAANAESFNTAFTQQLAYTVGATSLGLVFGLIAGVAAAKWPRVEGSVFALLNVAQVLPALSFIGLLIVPMGWLGATVPALGAIGVSGIGWAPVFVVLLCYALYPITRNVFTGMRSLDHGIVDAAVGMGMKPRQRLASVELPLISPVVLAGVRIAAVQTTAAAILAALVGGGGLGTIVFFGVQQTAEDLVLLGVIPIVAMSLTIDSTLRFAEGVIRARWGGAVA
jgi:osmoprotectant transport system permease protein